MLSVIVPVYNSEKFIQRCIDSILYQTYTDFELILVDDGSTDSSSLICDKYAEKDARIKTYHISNRGANNARLLGVHKAIGQFVMFIDADDTISPNYLEIMSKEICNSNKEIVVHHPCYDKELVSKEMFIVDMLNARVSPTMYEKIFSLTLLQKTYKNLPRYITMGEDLMQNVIIAACSSAIKYFKDENISYNYNIDNLSSISNTFKREYSYEVQYYTLFESFLFSQNKHVIESYLRSKFNGLALVLLSGNNLDYDDEYYISCLNEYRSNKFKIPEAWILFHIRNNHLARFFIKHKRYIVEKLNKIKNK